MGLGFFLNNKKINMKRTITSTLFTALCVLSASAQLANGYYRVQNATTERYISIADTKASNYSPSPSGSVNMQGIRTIKSFSRVATSPSTVIYVKNISGNQYDFQGQGSSLYTMSGNRLYVTLTAQSNGTYKASGSYSGITIDIADGTSTTAEEDFLRNKSKTTASWKAVKIDDSNYIGIKPDIEADGAYYGTIYAGFPFKLASSGMKAYYVNSAAGSGFDLKEISGTIPAGTPVIIKCSSNDPANNKIEPVTTDGTKLSDNKLRGVYCALTGVNGHFNATPYTSSTMRVLGVSSGKLAFVKASSSALVDGKYLQANKAYLNVPANADNVMVVGGNDIRTIETDQVASSKQGLYTLTGIRLPDGATPRPGIYIKDGKKVVIK